MAISYVGGQASGKAGANSGGQLVTFALTGGSNSTPQTDDLVIVTAVVGSAAANPAMAVTTPTGYTALGQLNQSAATNDVSMNVSYKFMGATPDTTVTIPAMNSNTIGQAWTIQVFRGVHSGTPMDVTPVAAGATGTGQPNPGSITPVTNDVNGNAWVVICGGGATVTPANYVAPANFTTNFLTSTGTDSTSAMAGSGYWTGWTSGAVDPAAYTGGTALAANSWASYTIALRAGKPRELIETFQEDFNAPLDTGKWTTDVLNGSVTFQNGTGDFSYSSTVNGTHASLVSVDSFVFKDSSVYYKVEVAPDWGAGNPAGGEFSFTVESPGDNRIDWTIYSNNTLALIKFTNNTWGSIKDVSTSFRANKDTYRWLRFRETAGTTYFESAPSTASNPPIAGDWVVQHSGATSSFPINALNAKIIYRLWMSNPVAGIASPMPSIDGLNTASGAPVTGDTIAVPKLAEIQTLLAVNINAKDVVAVPRLIETQTFRDVNVNVGERIAVPTLIETQTLLAVNVKVNVKELIPRLIETQTLLAVNVSILEIIAVPRLQEVQTFLAVNLIAHEALPIDRLAETQTLYLPAIVALGGALNNLIFVADTANIAPTAGDNASSLPLGVHTDASGIGTEGVLSAFWGGASQQASRVANAKNNLVDAQSYYFGRFSTRPLAAQTIPAQNWNYQGRVGETSVNANTFYWPVMYVWRPSNNTVVKHIFDAAADTGIEWPISISVVAQSFAGAQATTQEGDILVVECWAAGKQTTTGGTYAQTWQVTTPTSKIVSPYKLEYPPNSTLWVTSDLATVAPTAGDNATNLPLGVSNIASTIANEYLLSEIAPNDTNQIAVGTNAQSNLVAPQSHYLARYSTLPLAAQVIPAQTWSYELSTTETSDNSNTFWWPVLYVWRPGSGVVDHIFDAAAPVGLEWRVLDDPRLDQQFVGESVTTQNGDILVLEVWGAGQQTTAGGTYAHRLWTNSFNSRIVSPFKLTYAAALPPDIVAVPTVIEIQTLLAVNVNAKEAVAVPKITVVETLYAPEIAGITDLVAVPTLVETQTLLAVAVNAKEVVPVTKLTQVQTLLAVNINAKDVVAVPRLQEVQTLLPVSANAKEVVVIPTLIETQTLLPVNLNVGESIAVPRLIETQTLLPLVIREFVLATTLIQTQTLNAPNINVHERIVVPRLAETQTLFVPNISAKDVVAVPKLTQVQTLLAVNLIERLIVPTRAFIQTLRAPLIKETEYPPKLVFTQTLYAPTALEANQIAPDGPLEFTQTLLAVSINAREAVAVPRLIFAQTFNSVRVIDVVPVPKLTETQTLYAPNINARERILVPTLTETQTLNSVNINQGERLAIPRLAEVQTLLVPAVNAREIVTFTKLTQTQTLFVPNVSVSAAVIVPKITSIQVLYAPNVNAREALAVAVKLFVETLYAPNINVREKIVVPVLSETQTFFDIGLAAVVQVTTRTFVQTLHVPKLNESVSISTHNFIQSLYAPTLMAIEVIEIVVAGTTEIQVTVLADNEMGISVLSNPPISIVV